MYRKRERRLRRSVLVLALALLVTAGLSAPVSAEEQAGAYEEAVESGVESVPVTPTPEPTPPPSEIMPTNGIEGWPKSLDTNGDYVCLMDADTGAILLEKGMDTATPPASLTKIMTTLLALENADNLDAEITMDETGVQYAVSGSSSLYTQVGEVFHLKDALYGVMLKSANDLATQVGKYIGGGDLDAFVSMMNDRAASLGCTSTHFVNACGMPAEGHVSSAHDMALIFSEALKNETFREIIHTDIYTIPATNMTEERIFQNHQPFISNPEWNTYEGILGGKTGYTDLAGSCLVTGCEQNGMTLIAVTMHCDSSNDFCLDTKQMLDYGFDGFAHQDAASSDQNLISGGTVTLPKDASAADCTYEDAETTGEDGNTEVVRTYYWNGRAVGTSVYEGTIQTSEESASGTESGEALSGLSDSGGTSDGSAVSAASSPEDGEISFVGFTMSRTGFFALSVLAVLVLVALIFLIITLLLRDSRRNRGGK